jgi:hypothetical protein
MSLGRRTPWQDWTLPYPEFVRKIGLSTKGYLPARESEGITLPEKALPMRNRRGTDRLQRIFRQLENNTLFPQWKRWRRIGDFLAASATNRRRDALFSPFFRGWASFSLWRH